jgi:hypothetical protein
MSVVGKVDIIQAPPPTPEPEPLQEEECPHCHGSGMIEGPGGEFEPEFVECPNTPFHGRLP